MGSSLRFRDTFIQPREEPETIPFHREVPLWELGEVTEHVTDDDYRHGVYWDLGGLYDQAR